MSGLLHVLMLHVPGKGEGRLIGASTVSNQARGSVFVLSMTRCLWGPAH